MKADLLLSMLRSDWGEMLRSETATPWYEPQGWRDYQIERTHRRVAQAMGWEPYTYVAEREGALYRLVQMPDIGWGGPTWAEVEKMEKPVYGRPQNWKLPVRRTFR